MKEKKKKFSGLEYPAPGDGIRTCYEGQFVTVLVLSSIFLLFVRSCTSTLSFAITVEVSKLVDHCIIICL
jgi:hypothetical protein